MFVDYKKCLQAQVRRSPLTFPLFFPVLGGNIWPMWQTAHRDTKKCFQLWVRVIFFVLFLFQNDAGTAGPLMYFFPPCYYCGDQSKTGSVKPLCGPSLGQNVLSLDYTKKTSIHPIHKNAAGGPRAKWDGYARLPVQNSPSSSSSACEIPYKTHGKDAGKSRAQ